MTRKTPTHFRMQMDDGTPDSLIQEEILDSRIERLGHRITLLAILIPVFIVVILVLAYLDLTKRVIRFQDTGSTELSSLANNLEDRFSSLSVKQAKLEESYGKIASSVNKALDNDKEVAKSTTLQIKKLEHSIIKSIDGITKSNQKIVKSKVDRTELKTALSKLKKTLTPIEKDVKGIAAELKALDKTFAKELTHLNGSLADFNELLADLNKRIDQETNRLSKLQQDITDVSIEKIDQSALQKALEEEKTIYRQMMSLITKNLEKRIDTLQKEIQAIEEKQRSILKQNSVTPPAKSIPKTAAPSVEPPKTQAPGKIIEETIPQS